MYRHVCGAPVLGLLFLFAMFEIRGGFSYEPEWFCNQGNGEVGTMASQIFILFVIEVVPVALAALGVVVLNRPRIVMLAVFSTVFRLELCKVIVYFR